MVPNKQIGKFDVEMTFEFLPPDGSCLLAFSKKYRLVVHLLINMKQLD